MPWIIDYPIVVQAMREMKLRSLYFNSGVFGFSAEVATKSVGWTGPEDLTMKLEAQYLLKQVSPPYEKNLGALLLRLAGDFSGENLDHAGQSLGV